MEQTPRANRVHIGFFGRRNAGKSSLINAIAGQTVSVVSPVCGTTTDTVEKAMELLPIGAVVLIDTPGLDDAGTLGALRVRQAKRALTHTDIAVMVIDAVAGVTPEDRKILQQLEQRHIPTIQVWNKCDQATPPAENAIAVSAATGEGIRELKEELGRFYQKLPIARQSVRLFGSLLHPEDVVLLVTPIDESAPKGRMILPQQQAIRDILDTGAAALVTQPDQLPGLLAGLRTPPRLVITDSQAFAEVAAMLPAEMPLTSFSILMARYKGYLSGAVAGAAALDRLQDGDRILMAEGCTHHRQCNDIGTVKIPNWLRQHTGKRLEIATCSGGDFPQDLTPYAVIIHCGGCMLNDREIAFRQQQAMQQGVPFTNYGVTVAKMKGILARSLAPLAEIGECI